LKKTCDGDLIQWTNEDDGECEKQNGKRTK